jgi:hypothetical protein
MVQASTHGLLRNAAVLVLASMVALASTSAAVGASTVTVGGNLATPQTAFASAEIRKAAASAADDAAPLEVEFAIDSASLKPQAYRLERVNGAIRITGGDANGVMYGGLDVAEAVRLGTLVEMRMGEHRPYIASRGIKFNITPDRRTPSYSDNSDSAQSNIPNMWSLDFWHEYLDEMARQRFNVLSLWNLHPFPSIVKVPEFPDVALNDVWGQKAGNFDLQFSMNSSAQAEPFKLGNVEVVKTMTMDRKIQFWRDVMQYAKDRGIDMYWFTWNIFVWGTQGQYGLTADGNNPKTIAYFRASVRETVKTYPLLAGIGITAGENMNSRQGPFDHEAWLWQTYGEGIRDALKDQPGRQFRLIHRFHQTGQKNILDAFKDYPGPFDFSFKYSVAHMYSTPKPMFVEDLLKLMSPTMHTWLTVRNDDIFSFRWGDPEYARQYVTNIPGPDRVAGFYMGPDGYNWGREFIDREPETPRQLVMQKQWYSFMLWGRLSYDPTLPNALFERTLAVRFPQVPAAKLYAAIASASKIIPQTTRFFWGDIDIRWFPEACSQSSGFYTVRQFVEGQSMPGAGVLNIRQWRTRLAKGAVMEGMTPMQVADALNRDADEALALVAELHPLQGDNKELRLTLGDCEAMAQLGHYYAQKILGAADLALFDQSGLAEQQASAVRHLQAALEHWQKYAAVATSQYMPQKLGRVGAVDLNKLTAKVEADIALAKDWTKGSIRGDGEVRSGDVNFRP